MLKAEGDDESPSTFEFWLIPTVLGTKPNPSKGHSAILLNDDRILVIKGNSTTDSSFWFLEVNTPFVREQKLRLCSKVVSWSKGVIGEAEKLVVISGPSGVGKVNKREMSMKEKHKLGVGLQSAQEKMPQFVKIIRKRNEHLVQDSDEMELDIEEVEFFA